MLHSTPLVLVTGQLLTQDVWAPQIAHFTNHREVMIADHTLDDTISGMATRLLASAPARFALCGHAMGGFVAFEVMRQAPERVERLALLATLASADGPAQTARRQGYIELVKSGRFDQVAEERLPMVLSSKSLQDSGLRDLVRTMAQQTGPDVFLRQQRAIMGRIDSRPGLTSIAVPTLIVWGEADGITTREHHEEIAAGVPLARRVNLSGVGHLITLEAPVEINGALDAWLA